MDSADLLQVNIEDFQPYLNQPFLICFSAEDKLPADLISVTASEKYEEMKRQPFSLIFKTGKKEYYYKQGTYIVEHPEKGNIQMFLVPIATDEKRVNYQAIFS